MWSAATYNNTIVNDNFLDYRLASPNPVTVNMDTSDLDFGFDAPPQSVESKGENRTLRRNTNSAPEDIMQSSKSSPERQKKSAVTNELWVNTSFDARGRDRSSTFTIGKKYKMDKHVLLKHEEELDVTSLENLGVLRDIPERQPNDHVTEL